MRKFEYRRKIQKHFRQQQVFFSFFTFAQIPQDTLELSFTTHLKHNDVIFLWCLVLSIKAYRVCLQQMVLKTQKRLSSHLLHLSKQTVFWFLGLKRTTYKQKWYLCPRNHLDFFKLGRPKHQRQWISSSYSTLPQKRSKEDSNVLQMKW